MARKHLPTLVIASEISVMIKQAAVTLLCMLTSCASAWAGDMGMPMPPSSGAADRAFMRSMDAMHRAMAAPMTGNADNDFVSMMLPHHQGAVEMARIELKYGKDPTMRALATDIVAAQEKEIAAMTAWQAKHGR